MVAESPGRGGPLRPTTLRAKKLIVPELTGMPWRDAAIVLDQAGFPAPVLRYVEAYAAESHVVAQNPLRGQLVDATVAVELQVSKANWARFLPQLYQANDENALLREFLWIFQQLQDKINARLDQGAALFRPPDTDAAFLDWLASWIALHLEPDWPAEKKRKWLRHAPALYAMRGTKSALLDLLEMYVGTRPEIHENTWPFEPFRVGVHSEIGASSTILPALQAAHCFVVHFPMPASAMPDELIVRVHRVIQAEKPAHTHYFLTFASDEASYELQPFLTIGENPAESVEES